MAIINTVPRNINPYAQWLSHYLHPKTMLVQFLKFLTLTPSDYLNTHAQWQY